MGVTFTPQAAKRIADVVKRVERMPRSLTGQRTPARPVESSFWALLLGTVSTTGLLYSFVRVTPDASGETADFKITNGLAYKFTEEHGAEIGYAREASGNRHVPDNTVVKVDFIGYDADDLPAYLFQYIGPLIDRSIPVHDHRDVMSGGFAFACYHPGTALPQNAFHV